MGNKDAFSNSLCDLGFNRVPSIRVMLGGRPETIDATLAGLKKRNPVPVLVVPGSGRAADILAYAHKLVNWNHIDSDYIQIYIVLSSLFLISK